MTYNKKPQKHVKQHRPVKGVMRPASHTRRKSPIAAATRRDTAAGRLFLNIN